MEWLRRNKTIKKMHCRLRATSKLSWVAKTGFGITRTQIKAPQVLWNWFSNFLAKVSGQTIWTQSTSKEIIVATMIKIKQGPARKKRNLLPRKFACFVRSSCSLKWIKWTRATHSFNSDFPLKHEFCSKYWSKILTSALLVLGKRRERKLNFKVENQST